MAVPDETVEVEEGTTVAVALPDLDVAAAKTGWELVEEKCTVCHPLTTIDEARLDWAGWEEAVGHMLDNGAELTDAEQESVLAYLGTRDAVKTAGAELVATECMVCHPTTTVDEAVLDWAGWEESVDHMIDNGAQLDEEQAAVIVEYLVIRGPQG